MLCRRIAVEVFDSGCFCSNQQQPLGKSVMRIQLLNACGWQVSLNVSGWVTGSADCVAECLHDCACHLSLVADASYLAVYMGINGCCMGCPIQGVYVQVCTEGYALSFLMQLVTVPYYDWVPLGGDDNRKMAYLRNMLGIPGAGGAMA